MVPALIVGGALAAASIANNMYNASQQEKAANRAEEGALMAAGSVADAWGNTKKTYDENKGYIDKFGNKITDLYGDEAAVKEYAAKYKDLLSQDMSDAIYNPTDFNYQGSIEQFYDKGWKLNNQMQLDALENSASNAGNLYSSGLINQMSTTASANAEKAYKDALEAYMKDKQIEADIWGTEEGNKQAAAKQYLDLYRGQLDAYGRYMGDAMGAWGDYTSALINNNNSKANTYANYVGNYTNLLANAGGASGQPLNY